MIQYFSNKLLYKVLTILFLTFSITACYEVEPVPITDTALNTTDTALNTADGATNFKVVAISLETRLDNPVTFSLDIENIDNQELIFIVNESPQKGVVEFNDNNSITYTPTLGVIGLDQFRVQVSNGLLTITATVTIDNNLSLKGRVVIDDIDDIDVVLSGDEYFQTLTPDNSGEFKFYGLPDGESVIKVSKGGYKSSVAKTLQIESSQLSTVSEYDFVLSALDQNNFSFHWEEDQSISGYEYSTLIPDPEFISVAGSAGNKLQHDYNIRLVNTGDVKWTQEHAYRIVEIMKLIPLEKRVPYSFQSLPESKWQLTSDFILNDIQVSGTDESKVVTISDAIFINKVTEGKRQSFYSQELHAALMRFVTDDIELIETSLNAVSISEYVFPGKIKRVDITVDGLPEEDKSVTIEIDTYSLEYGAKTAYLRVFSEIGSFADVVLRPVDENGGPLNYGEISTMLKGTFTLSKSAKGGFWSVQQIVIEDFVGGKHSSEANDFGWELYVNNPFSKGLIFSENFDAQADWTTAGREAIGELPTNWDAARTDENWHPAEGDIGSQPSMQINGNDSTQIYGGSGKAFITYSESYNDESNNGFTSDGILTKDIPDADEVYLEFKIKFQPGWVVDSQGGQIKVARIVHWDGPDSGTGERGKFFTSGNNAPMYIYDWAQTNIYGVRHFHAFRCDDQETNYYCNSPAILDVPRQIVTGDMSANYSTHVAREFPEIPDLVNGGVLNYTGTHFHNQVWGDVWHTVGIHVKINSVAGVQDGMFQYWLDGQKLMSLNQVAWIGNGGNINAKWNSISFGGNDLFHFNLDESASYSDRERWYAIDDIEVYNKLPEWLID